MITEDKTEEAARLKAFRILSCDSLEDPERTLMDAFEDGIDWYKDNLWHSFREEPQWGEKILYADISGGYGTTYGDEGWDDFAAEMEVLQWCYLSDILKMTV